MLTMAARSDIPIPPARRNPNSVCGRIRALKLGESEWFAHRLGREQSAIATSGLAVARAKDAPPGMKFTTRACRDNGVDGTRIWRIA